jgi:hypothetical protein
MANGIDLTQSSKVNLDVKTLVGIIFLVLAMGGGYVTLQGQIAALQLDVVRLQDQQEMNTEFRIKWPRGELGALPDALPMPDSLPCNFLTVLLTLWHDLLARHHWMLLCCVLRALLGR